MWARYTKAMSLYHSTFMMVGLLSNSAGPVYNWAIFTCGLSGLGVITIMMKQAHIYPLRSWLVQWYIGSKIHIHKISGHTKRIRYKIRIDYEEGTKEQRRDTSIVIPHLAKIL